MWTAISSFFSTIFNAIYSVVSTVWNAIYSTITGIWNSIWSVIEPLVTAFGYLFDTIFQAIQIVVSNVMDAIKNTITTVWNAIVSFLTPILNTIQSVVTTVWYVIGDKDAGTVQISDVMTFTGTLNPSCTADLIWGMHADTYYYAGFFDDWFLDVDSELTAEDLKNYFLAGLLANGGVMSGDVDALTDSPNVTLRATDSVYPTEGTLYISAVECNLAGSGRVSVSCEYVSGTTAVTDIQTSTSDDLETWSDWADIGTNGKLESPNAAYIRFRMTLTTTDTSQTPKITDIRLYDIAKAAIFLSRLCA